MSTDEGLSGTYHYVFYPDHLTSKMEDAANNCCVVTTLRNCGCGSAPHLQAGWQVHCPSRYFHSSLLLVVVLILVAHHCLRESCLLTVERRVSWNLQHTLLLRCPALLLSPRIPLLPLMIPGTLTLGLLHWHWSHVMICHITWISTTPIYINLHRWWPSYTSCGVSF